MISPRGLPLIFAALAACNPPTTPERAADTETRAGPPASTAPTTSPAVPRGEECVALADVDAARPLADDRIDFVLRSGTVLRNDLPAACPGLRENRYFTFPPERARLCAGESIRVVDMDGGPALSPPCKLGRFVAAE